MTAGSSKPGGWAVAIETSGATGSVAIGEGCSVAAAVRFSRPRAHAIEFFPAIERLCREHRVAPAMIRRVYVSAGPGSFTGLRIGITAARTLALAVHARVVPVPTLEVIAQNAGLADFPPKTVAVLLDAKRSHVYAARFRHLQKRAASVSDVSPYHYAAICNPVEASPGEFLAGCGEDCAVMGEGVLYHRAAVEASGRAVLPEALFPPRAEIVFALGAARAVRGQYQENPRDLIPIYIRPPEAEEKWAQKHGGG